MTFLRAVFVYVQTWPRVSARPHSFMTAERYSLLAQQFRPSVNLSVRDALALCQKDNQRKVCYRSRYFW